MKRFVLPSVLIMLLATFAESYGDGEERLVGTKWKLVEAYIDDEQGQRVKLGYSRRNIIYEFHGKDKLVVTGKTDTQVISDNFGEGEHYYKYNDQRLCPPETVCCLPVPNLYIDNPPLGEGRGRYFANVTDTTLNIFRPSEWGLSLIRLK